MKKISASYFKKATETEKNEAGDKYRDCLEVDKCDFYDWFINGGKYGIPGFPKETVDKFLLQEECELDEEGNVVKGKTTI